MKIECTEIVLTENGLREKMNKPGLLNINRLIIGKRPVSDVELKYVEYLFLDYEVTYRSGLFRKKSGEMSDGRESIHIRLIGNGSTGSVSLLDTELSTMYAEVEKTMIQGKDYDATDMSRDAKNLIAKVMRKSYGRRMLDRISLCSVKSVYRPFWAVYYGEPREKDGGRLCWPCAADGFTVRQ